ncbi:MAG: glycosyltransferase [Methanotrichaceae archaeon]
MISVVCVYNNRQILEEYLLESLRSQTVDYELMLVDNTTGTFSSAAKALNYGGANAVGKYLMFVHQDVKLLSSTWLEDVEMILESLHNIGVAGIAGVSEQLKGISSNLKEGDPPMKTCHLPLEKPLEVQTLDECLIIIPKIIFDEHILDEEVCDDWHLYAVDYCLSIKQLGYRVFVLPNLAHHRSAAYSMSSSYYSTLKKVLKKHKDHYPMIYTTMGSWNTSHSVCTNGFCLKLNKTRRYISKMKGLAMSKMLSLHAKR